MNSIKVDLSESKIILKSNKTRVENIDITPNYISIGVDNKFFELFMEDKDTKQKYTGIELDEYYKIKSIFYIRFNSNTIEISINDFETIIDSFNGKVESIECTITDKLECVVTLERNSKGFNTTYEYEYELRSK